MSVKIQLEELEKQLIRRAFEESHGDVDLAVQKLGYPSRITLYRRLEKFDMYTPRMAARPRKVNPEKRAKVEYENKILKTQPETKATPTI